MDGWMDRCAQSKAASWNREVMPLGDFIRNFVQADLDDGTQGRQKGYLAQYSLFDQIPSLREDFSVPPYCGELLPGPDEDDAKARATAAAQGAGPSRHLLKCTLAWTLKAQTRIVSDPDGRHCVAVPLAQQPVERAHHGPPCDGGLSSSGMGSLLYRRSHLYLRCTSGKAARYLIHASCFIPICTEICSLCCSMCCLLACCSGGRALVRCKQAASTMHLAEGLVSMTWRQTTTA